MATFIGTESADNITGTNAGDTILGNGGNDTLTGGTGADVINGGTGDDTMSGLAGNDTYYVNSAADVVIEAAGNGTDFIASSVNYTIAAGSAVEWIYYSAQTNATNTPAAPGVATVTGTTGIAFTGNEFTQIMFGTTGNDFLAGGRNSAGFGGDQLIGGAGDDTFLVSNANDLVFENGGEGNDTVFVSITALEASGQAVATFTLNGAEVETISAQSQRDTQNFILTGNGFSQKVIGNFGNNTLNGGGGTDTLIGLEGNDTYVITARAAGNDVIEESSGFDSIVFAAGGTASYTLAAGVSIESITLSNGVTSVTGNELSQTITGSAAAETLNGGGGADTLVGGDGNDTYIVNVDGVTITETTVTGAGANDVVIFNGTTGGINLADSAVVETMAVGDATTGARLAYNGSQTAGAAAGVYLVGNTTAQIIYGAGGADILNGDRGSATGAAAADTLAGGAGNDTYRVYAQADVVSELQFDATGAFTAGTNAGGTDTIYTSASYSLATNAGATVGGVANAATAIETLSAADQSATTAMTLTGYVNAERLIGNMGANTLSSGVANGVAAGDTLIGLGGDDTYIIFNQADVVTEAQGGGVDTINFDAGVLFTSYTLAAGSEVDTINMGGAVVNVTGNALNQVINGTNADNTITSGGGADILVGNDGNDTYFISDSLAVVQDTQGLNVVNYTGTTGGYNVNNASAISQINATAATGDVYLVGNNQVQTINGNGGNNILNGAGGTDAFGQGDTLAGGAGDDVYRVYTSNINGAGAIIGLGETIIEAGGNGNDTVYTSANYGLAANVENLIAADQANVTTLTLVGNGLNNVISGSNGNNVLVGGVGIDTLTGLGGADTFHFNEVGVTNADIITDFNGSQGDRISLDAGDFALGTSFDSTELQFGTVATGTAAVILYDQPTGRLFYDADGAGAGAATLFATVSAGTVLTDANFVVTPAGTLPTP